jgi:IS4 transposase
LDNLTVQLGALYVFDRGYVDYKRLYKININCAFFVVRAKSNLSFKVLKSNKIDKTTGVRCDQIIRFKLKKSYEDYPANLRRIKVYDEDLKKHMVLLTNNFEISTFSIVLLYKKRWKIELFFKWIKQHLKIKVFWGQNENAVRSQIWIAVCNYALIHLLKHELNLSHSPYEILEILKDSLFEQVPVNQLLMS